MREVIASAAILMLAGGPAAAQENAGDPRFAGCYAVEIGEWSPARADGNVPFQTPPDTALLSERTGRSGEDSPFEVDRTVVRPVIAEGRTPSAFWSARGDSVRVVWTNGFAGVRLHLAAAEEGRLRGTAEAFTDLIGPPIPTADATLQPVACPEARPD